MMSIGQIVLGRYRIDDLIGLGGEGWLAKALDQQTGQTVAVKQLELPPAAADRAARVARFQRAAQTRIGHPGVVDPLDHGEDQGVHYMVMPFIAGVDLEAYTQQHGGHLPVEIAVPLIAALAEALAAIHQQGIVHRDLKPANILIDTGGQTHIIDFGICRNLNDKTIVDGGGIIGTYLWMSPEQAWGAGPVDHRSDLYALGTVFYYTLTGTPAAAGADLASLTAAIRLIVPPPPRQLIPSIPPQVDQACMQLLAKRPEDRFQSAGEFCRALTGSGPAPAQVSASACPSCGLPQFPDVDFCPRCGACFKPPSNGGVYCIACGSAAASEACCPSCHRIFSRCQHRLVFTSGPLTGLTFRIPEGQYEVGREHLLHRDRHISRCHARISCCNGSVFLQDAGSANKTYVAGRLASAPLQLQPGAEVRIAGNQAIFN